MLFQDRGYNNFGTYFLSGSEQTPMFGICFEVGLSIVKAAFT